MSGKTCARQWWMLLPHTVDPHIWFAWFSSETWFIFGFTSLCRPVIGLVKEVFFGETCLSGLLRESPARLQSLSFYACFCLPEQTCCSPATCSWLRLLFGTTELITRLILQITGFSSLSAWAYTDSPVTFECFSPSAFHHLRLLSLDTCPPVHHAPGIFKSTSSPALNTVRTISFNTWAVKASTNKNCNCNYTVTLHYFSSNTN